MDHQHIHHCWQDIPEYSVYDTFGGRKREELLLNDIVEIADIPDDFETTDRQYINIPSFKHNQIHIDKEAVRGFLNTDVTDPRPDFIKSLTENCGDIGSVIVYNQSFEAGINNQLAVDFPEYSVRIDSITDRMVDLLVPFRSRWLYHPDMKGSASLKAVLPAFVPELSYDNLTFK